MKQRQIFLMDLWATVPYYVAYLAHALSAAGEAVQVGSISYYLDPRCFTERGLKTQPGLLDIAGRLPAGLPAGLRRGLKLVEAAVNMLALAVRWSLRAPAIVHVQFLPLLRYGYPRLRRGFPAERWLLRLARRRGARLVLTVHDILPHDTGERFRELFQDLYGEMDALICHSEPVRARLVGEFGIAPERVHVIAHGPFFYDLPAWPEAREEAGGFAVLWQGIVLPYKGVDVLLAAWALVEVASPDATLHIAGPCSPPQAEAMAAEVTRLGLKRVRLDHRFLPTDELARLYREADAVVFPYLAITTSGALATALALGSTIVASDLPVFREQLQDGETALLVPPRDPQALADALLRLYREPALRRQLAAHTRALEFGERSWETIARQTVAVYDSVSLQAGLVSGKATGGDA